MCLGGVTTRVQQGKHTSNLFSKRVLRRMASLKADKPVGTQAAGQAKKEPAKAGSTAPKASKPAGSKKAEPKSQPKKKAGGKSSAAKN